MKQLTISVYQICKWEICIIIGGENEAINHINILLFRLISMGKL
jgi:hypothetical protein